MRRVVAETQERFMSGAARVIHLDKNANFINQWYGDITGPGKFFQVHGIDAAGGVVVRRASGR